jgi:hypothetical protein
MNELEKLPIDVEKYMIANSDFLICLLELKKIRKHFEECLFFRKTDFMISINSKRIEVTLDPFRLDDGFYTVFLYPNVSNEIDAKKIEFSSSLLMIGSYFSKPLNKDFLKIVVSLLKNDEVCLKKLKNPEVEYLALRDSMKNMYDYYFKYHIFNVNK